MNLRKTVWLVCIGALLSLALIFGAWALSQPKEKLLSYTETQIDEDTFERLYTINAKVTLTQTDILAIMLELRRETYHWPEPVLVENMEIVSVDPPRFKMRYKRLLRKIHGV